MVEEDGLQKSAIEWSGWPRLGELGMGAKARWRELSALIGVCLSVLHH